MEGWTKKKLSFTYFIRQNEIESQQIVIFYIYNINDSRGQMGRRRDDARLNAASNRCASCFLLSPNNKLKHDP